VVNNGGKEQIVEKTFEGFTELRDELALDYLSFPSEGVQQINAARREERRRGLEIFLRGACEVKVGLKKVMSFIAAGVAGTARAYPARRDRGGRGDTAQNALIGRVNPIIFLFLCRKKRTIAIFARAFCTLAARLWQVRAGARTRRRREVNQGAL
jgi:hypothetical protein